MKNFIVSVCVLFGILGAIIHPRHCHGCPTDVAAHAGFRSGMEIMRGHERFRLREVNQVIYMVPVSTGAIATTTVEQNVPAEVDFVPQASDTVVSTAVAQPQIVAGSVILRNHVHYRIDSRAGRLVMIPMDGVAGLTTTQYMPVASDVILTESEAGPLLRTLGGIGRFATHGFGGGHHH